MKISSLILFLFIHIHSISHAQSDSTRLKALATGLEKLSARKPVEKIYLQLNKPGYDPGDTIWFKGYVTAGAHHQPSALSGVVYVELLDGAGKTLKLLQLKNNNGITAGDFELNGKLSTGTYHLRAYTSWMRNAGPEYFYNRSITVGDAAADALFVTPNLVLTNNNDVQTQLSYTDSKGRPFNWKPVNYEVRADTNLLYKGKGITDDKGNLSFTFPGKTAPGQRIRLISHIRVVQGVTVDKLTQLNVPNEDADVQFFPEGGQLINGVRSKVAFKAIGTNGLGINIKGTVVDNDNNEVAEFNSQHAGMGFFAFTPQTGKTYTAKIKLSDQIVINRTLPKAEEKGFVLSVNPNTNDTTKLNIRIATNEATLKEKQGTPFYIIGQNSGTVYFTTAGKLDNRTYSIPVPKDRFPTGIAQFTLFTNNNEPQNERITFIQNKEDILDLNLTSTKATYAEKEKVTLQLTAKDNQNKPIAGSFSVTVYNEDTTPTNENTESTILSDLLLTSDLQGNIEEPNYYFNNSESQTRADLDVLMLTQGYRRYNWQEATSTTATPIAYQPEKSLTLTGTVTADDNKKKPIIGGKISALATTAGITTDAITDEQGRFTLTGLNITDSAKLVLQAKKADGNRYVDIKISSKASPSVTKSAMTAQAARFQPNITASLSSTIPTGKADSNSIATSIKNNPFRFNQANTLKEVTIKQQRKNYGTEFAPWQIEVTHSDNLNGPGHADQVLGYQELGECFNIADCLRARIPAVNVSHDGMMFVRNQSKSFTKPPQVVFIVDGSVLGTSMQKLEDLVYVGNIMTIEVLKSGSYLSVYGSTAPGGALIITTKKGTEGLYTGTWEKEAPGILTSEFKGFNVPKKFYVPKYTAKTIAVPDTRDAIYWNPDIITNEKGTLPLEFYNPDVKGTYRAVVEGIDNDGNLGRYVYRYKVE